MGMGQFMPSSYREFAVDGNGDGTPRPVQQPRRRLLLHRQLFPEEGRRARRLRCAVARRARAELQPGQPSSIRRTWTPDYTLADLAQRGYRPLEPVAPDATATVISLEGSTGKQYWFGFQNYYAITRYNNSKMYAMAVYQLAQAIAGTAPRKRRSHAVTSRLALPLP